MNLANKLTVARICMVPLFILFLELDGFLVSVFALIVFITASITDLLDGRIARRQNTITSLGIFLDPLADKLLISAAFICFVGISYLNVPAWAVIAIISREFLITGLRTIAATENVVIPADKTGKFKTTSQIVVIIIVLLIIIITEAFQEFYSVPPHTIALFKGGSYKTLALFLKHTPYWATLVAAVMTLYSGANYMWKHRGLLKESE